MREALELIDGPLAGRIVQYAHPLPLILAVASRNPIRWHDYIQTREADRYRHSTRCQCHERVDLDAVNE
jgi:hypothetical protein